MPSVSGFGTGISQTQIRQLPDFTHVHLGGTPFYVEDWSLTNAWNVLSQSATGRGGLLLENGPHGNFYGQSLARLISSNVNGGFVKIGKKFGPVRSFARKLGFELWYGLIDDGNQAGFDFGFEWYDKTNRHFGGVRYFDSGSTPFDLIAFDETQLSRVEDTFAQSGENLGWLFWHNFKLTVDFSTGKFQELYIDNRIYDVKNTSLDIVANTTNQHLVAYVRIHDANPAVLPAYIYLGPLFLTLE